MLVETILIIICSFEIDLIELYSLNCKFKTLCIYACISFSCFLFACFFNNKIKFRRCLCFIERHY